MNGPFRNETSADPLDRFETLLNEFTSKKDVNSGKLSDPGGLLNPESQKDFTQILRQTGKTPVLDAARWIDFGNNPRARVDKIFLARPFLRKMANEGDVVSFAGGVAFGGFLIDAVRVEGSDYVSKPAMRRNIESGRLQSTLVTMYAKKAKADMGKVAIAGNSAIGTSDASSLLLKSTDGWGVAMQNAIQYKSKGAQVSQGIFDALYRKQPSAFRDGAVWMGHSNLLHAYKNFMETRVGDAATQLLLQQNGGLKPGGLPFLADEAFSVSKAVPTSSATPAIVKSANQGGFRITSAAKQIKLDINNAGGGTGTVINLALTLPAGVTDGTVECSTIAAYINAQLLAAFPSVDGIDSVADVDVEGFLVLHTKQTGTTAEIDIQSVATDAYTELGFTAAATNGLAPGANTIASGTELWFTNPQNLLWGAVQNVEMYFTHVPRRDGYELIMFLEYAFKVENPEAASVCSDILLPFLA